ncbi:family 20 glycosylhydrolase [Mitsuaria sp. TWR114]|uniref:family 20 glycosylhydrolase n=1 Tax=Mitsuaria sp. TWR114 TaxID=2601731 RepID=UPI0011BDEB6A|nr:family 20 glycosylhydrolase [Mitsuaria sp. TWR114]TXD95946.1 family 20 glycosylhydrolase [Mitsuaria sp. TWR114]
MRTRRPANATVPRTPPLSSAPRLLRALRLVLALAAAGAAHAGTEAPVASLPMPAQVLPLVPLPAHLTRGEGVLRLASGAVIAVPAGDRGARRAASFLAAMAWRDHHLRLQVREGSSGAIVLRRDARTAADPKGAYELAVTPAGVTLQARDDAGLLYAGVSLWQLFDANANANANANADDARAGVDVPVLRIVDQPRFGWRGLMLDVVRHFAPLDELKALVDQMALHKLNVLHLHLSDDQGWRLEIKRYPDLTRIGGWRTPPGGEPARYGGFYTQAQMRELVAYAAERQITVVPELDMPGHAQAAVAAYPRLGVDIGDGPGRNPRPAVAVDYGVNPYLYNADESTLRFIEQVMDEVMAVFPSPFIHVGGDEAIKDQWKASPSVQARIRALGLANEEALQSWFIGRIGRYLESRGRRLIGWDEILEGGLPAGASVMSWRGTEGAVAAANLGHDVVLAPAGSLYLDNLQSARDDEPEGRLAQLPIEKVHAFEAMPAGLDADRAKHVLGLEAALWTEYMPSRRHREHAIFPRLAAVAEVAWSPAALRDWRGFVPRLALQRARYLRQGVNAADSAFAVQFDIDGGPAGMLAAGQAPVRLGNQLGYGQIRYTLDGSDPGPASPGLGADGQPLIVTLPARVRATAFDAAGRPLAAVREQRFDTATLLTRASNQLQACPSGEMGLRVPLRTEATDWAPVFNVNLLDACWIYPRARLDGVQGIAVDAGRLARNYGLAQDAVKVVQHPARTPAGELEVRQGDCTGPLLASLPLPAGSAPQAFTLKAPLPPLTGVQDLCLRFTAPIHGPLYAIDAARLLAAEPARP